MKRDGEEKGLLSFISPFPDFPMDGGLMREAQSEMVHDRVADVRGAQVKFRAEAELCGRALSAGSKREVREKTRLGACADL